MATHDETTGAGRGVGHTARRLTETKQLFKTSEFGAYVIVFLGILIAGNQIESGGNGSDYFGADKVWLYITILTLGYMLSRGIAKSGVRDPYDADRDDHHGDHRGDNR